MKTLFALIAFLSTVTITTSLFAQAGVSSGSVGAARAGHHRITPDGRYRMPDASLFRVEEFINYHRHDIPVPNKKENRVKLNVQKLDAGNGKSVIQVGIATPRALDFEQLRPMNLVLVIDHSGSMSGDRIANLKKSLHLLLKRFRKSDKIAIVGFNHQASVLLKATEKSKVDRIRKAIDSLAANGGTNLHAGLMLGYKTALQNFDAKRTNRLIFLTDGNANVGQTESTEIARQSKQCNDEGISLMTIGLGVDFNDGLLQEIANAGYGTTHFIADNKDIQKVFVDEVDSLLAPAAKNIKLSIDFGRNLSKTAKAPKVYGYSPKIEGKKMMFRLDDLNHGATQVVLTKLDSASLKQDPKITLSYVDAITNEKVKVSENIQQFASVDQSPSLKRNYAIAMVANSLRQAAVESNRDHCEKAAKALKKGITKAEKMMPAKDEHVLRVLKIAKKYHKEILDCIARNQD